MISREAYKTLTVTVSLIDSAENDNVFIRFERASIVSKAYIRACKTEAYWGSAINKQM